MVLLLCYLARCRDHLKSALKVQTTALITSISFAIQPFGAGVGAEITLKALSKFKSRRSNEHFLCNTAFRGWRRCRDHPKSAPFESENRFQHPLRFFSLFAFFTFLCYCPRESLGVCTTSSLIYRSYRLPLLERQISRRQR